MRPFVVSCNLQDPAPEGYVKRYMGKQGRKVLFDCVRASFSVGCVAVHPSIEGGHEYRVTHVPTGCSFYSGKRAKCIEVARAAARIEGLADCGTFGKPGIHTGPAAPRPMKELQALVTAARSATWESVIARVLAG